MQQSQRADYKQWCRLENENYQLKQQLQDLSNKYSNLKKQQTIFSQISKHAKQSEKQSQLQQLQQVQQMKEQFVAIARQKGKLEAEIIKLNEQLEDLKYRNAELRQINENNKIIHQKQIQYLKRDGWLDTDSKEVVGKGSRVKDLERRLGEKEREIQILEQQLANEREANAKNVEKLQKCSQIAKEMQQYYTNQLQSRQHTITQLQTELSTSKYHLHNIPDLPSPHTKLTSNLQTSEDCSSLKCSSIVSEYRQFHGQGEWGQDRWERVVEEMRVSYGREIAMYQEKVRYLLMKVEALQAEKSYLMKNRNSCQEDQKIVMIDTLQSVQSFNNQLINPIINSSKPSHQQSLNLLNQSKSSLPNDSFTQSTPKSQISGSLIRQNSRQSNNNIVLRPKLTTVKTPNKSVQKLITVGASRNSCSFQRVVLGERNQ